MKTAISKSASRRLGPLAPLSQAWGAFLAGCVLLAAPRMANATYLDTLTGGPYYGNKNVAGFTDGNTFAVAQFNVPSDLALDSSGTVLFVADRANNAIRKVTDVGNNNLSQTVTFLTSAQGISAPVAVAVDGGNNIYVLNHGNGSNGSIQQFDQFGNLVTLRAANLVNAAALTLDGSTNLHVVVNGNTVLRISSTATNTAGVIANAGTNLKGIAVLDDGRLALTDAGNHGIWLLNPADGTKTALTGFHGAGDIFGSSTYAKFNGPEKIAKAGAGMLVVTDRGNHRVKAVDPSGTVVNLYGVSSSFWYTSVPYPGWWDGMVCSVDQVGCPEAREPVGVTVAGNGDVLTTEVYYHVIRRTSGSGLTGPGGSSGGGTNVVVVNAPTLSPNSGYFPMGQTVTVGSPNPNVYYTMDGTEPTTNSFKVAMSGNSGGIRWTSSIHDLTWLRVKAFVGTNASATVRGLPAPANSIGIAPSVTGTIYGGIGSTVVVPVVVNLRTNDKVQSLQFRVEVAPNGGAPMVSSLFRSLDIMTSDFVPVVTTAQAGVVATAAVQAYSIGTTRGLAISAVGTNANVSFANYAVAAMLAIPVPATAIEGQTYSLTVSWATATSDGAQTPVALPPMAAATLLVTNVPYTVGDSAQGAWYNAGLFGDADLENNDVNNAFYASLGFRVPYSFTDVYDAMDAYPPDGPGFVGGDGLIRFLDWQTILQRSLRLNTNNYKRMWTTGGIRTNSTTVLVPPSLARPAYYLAPGVWYREALVGALPVGSAIPNGTVNVPVYVKTIPNSALAGLQFRASVTPDGAAPALTQPIQFIAASGVNGPQTQVEPLNQIGCGWSLGTVNLAAQSSNLLGYVRFTLPTNAGAGQTYSVSFAYADGAPDLSTPYTFESRRGQVAVLTAAPRASLTSDDWKTQFFGSVSNPSADDFADPDLDGSLNWQEYVAGTSPVDASSRLQVRSVSSRRAGGLPQLLLHWETVPDKVYEVVQSTSPSGPVWTSRQTIVGDGYDAEFVETNAAGAPRFYRLRVVP